MVTLAGIGNCSCNFQMTLAVNVNVNVSEKESHFELIIPFDCSNAGLNLVLSCELHGCFSSIWLMPGQRP
jgi:hypothetical protein